MRRLLLLAAGLSLGACSMSSDSVTLEVKTETIDATSGAFTLFSLVDSRTVASDSMDTSISWDIGFRGTGVVLNSGASGPGAAIGTLVATPFGAIDTVTVAGLAFRRDGDSTCESGTARAVCSEVGSAFGPYVDDGNGGITVDGSRTLVLRTGEALGYAKVEFVSYVPADPNAPEAGGTVTIRYLVNPRGRVLEPGIEVTL